MLILSSELSALVVFYQSSGAVLGHTMLRGDGTVPEDHHLCQEGELHAGLHLPAEKHNEDQPRTGYPVRPDDGG